MKSAANGCATLAGEYIAITLKTSGIRLPALQLFTNLLGSGGEQRVQACDIAWFRQSSYPEVVGQDPRKNTVTKRVRLAKRHSPVYRQDCYFGIRRFEPNAKEGFQQSAIPLRRDLRAFL